MEISRNDAAITERASSLEIEIPKDTIKAFVVSLAEKGIDAQTITKIMNTERTKKKIINAFKILVT